MKFEKCLDAFKQYVREEAQSLGCVTEKLETAPVTKDAYNLVYDCEDPKVSIRLHVDPEKSITLTYFERDEKGVLRPLCNIYCNKETNKKNSFKLQGGTFNQGELGKNLLVNSYGRILEILKK